MCASHVQIQATYLLIYPGRAPPYMYQPDPPLSLKKVMQRNQAKPK